MSHTWLPLITVVAGMLVTRTTTVRPPSVVKGPSSEPTERADMVPASDACCGAWKRSAESATGNNRFGERGKNK